MQGSVPASYTRASSLRADTFGSSKNCKPEAYGLRDGSELLLTDCAAVTLSSAGSLTLAAAISKAAACLRSFDEGFGLFLSTVRLYHKMYITYHYFQPLMLSCMHELAVYCVYGMHYSCCSSLSIQQECCSAHLSAIAFWNCLSANGSLLPACSWTGSSCALQLVVPHKTTNRSAKACIACNP